MYCNLARLAEESKTINERVRGPDDHSYTGGYLNTAKDPHLIPGS